MIDAILAGSVLAIAVAVAYVVYLAREQRISTTGVRGLALLCAVGLVAMLLTDWPSEVLADFWADHSVVAGVLSTVLLVGIGFLAFEDNDRRIQELLDNSVTAAGLGGIVDHVVDCEIALAMLSHPRPPDDLGWRGWDQENRPLRWLRDGHERVESTDGRPGPDDPRRFPPKLLAPVNQSEWRPQLVDQSVRRILAAIRDWSPVIRGSRNGTMVLIALSEIRKDLMELSSYLRAGRTSDGTTLLVSLRQRLRLLAHFLEVQSGAWPLRPEVLLTLQPLPDLPQHLEWSAEGDGHATFGRKWQDQLEASRITLQKTHADVD